MADQEITSTLFARFPWPSSPCTMMPTESAFAVSANSCTGWVLTSRLRGDLSANSHGPKKNEQIQPHPKKKISVYWERVSFPKFRSLRSARSSANPCRLSLNEYFPIMVLIFCDGCPYALEKHPFQYIPKNHWNNTSVTK